MLFGVKVSCKSEGGATMHLAEMEMEIQSATGAPNWYALFTRHQHEKSVAFALSNKNHEVYLPLYRSVRRWQDRAKQLWLPVVPVLRVYPRGDGPATPNTHHAWSNPHRGMGRAPGDCSEDSIGCGQANHRKLPQRRNSPVSAVRRSRTGQNRAFDGAGRDFDPQKREWPGWSFPWKCWADPLPWRSMS